ncbi:hypothetical protein CY35_05G130800 [Sphagnum magellanicum]|nr:hypothetical protein CY35_05G130800 [Sphagnum magellanicum]KAH9563541.1 hypothetical protein CY35_05G130800 [Sphagnum magellanicum]KAH9563542.1 hypothetical protein CY35_05G130800 [Sphagnum magellanicum]
MIGTKKMHNAQFYVEVMEVVQSLGGNRRSMMYPDEIEEEQQERDRHNEINKEFRVFVKRMTELWDHALWTWKNSLKMVAGSFSIWKPVIPNQISLKSLIKA